MAGLFAFFDFLRGVPTVVLDPIGALIDALLLNIAQFSLPYRQRLWQDIIYIDMSGRSDSIVPFPLLYELGGETRQDIAGRFLETCRSLDPHLQSASIQGFNSLYRVGSPTGVILSALGLQLDSALDLLRHPEQWLSRFDEAVARYPEAESAAAFFRQEYLPLLPKDRLALTNTYRGKIEPILHDPTMREMFCTAPAGVTFDEVVRGRKLVLIDLRNESSPKKRAFKIRTAYDHLLAYVRHRGPGKHRPLAVYIDELADMIDGQASLNADPFAQDLDNLINVIARNHSLWLCLAHQAQWQMSERTQKTLLSMGTQIVGVVPDIESAEQLARQFADLDVARVKRYERVWASENLPGGYGGHGTSHFVIDHRIVDSPLEEQVYEMARQFMALRPFEFFVRPRDDNRLRRISAARFVGTPWPTDYPEVLAHIRRQLARRMGNSSPPLVAAGEPMLPTPPTPSVILEETNPYDTSIDDLPITDDYWETYRTTGIPASGS